MLRFLAFLAALGALSPAMAQDRELAQSHAALQARDQYLLDVGWKLATGNAAYCANVAPAIGMVMQDVEGYGPNADRIRRLLGLEGTIAVQAVAAESPAALAGLSPNRELLQLDDRDLHTDTHMREEAWQRLTELHDAVELSLADDGAIRLAWRGADGARLDKTLSGVPACASRFEVWDHGTRASAEGTRVIFGRDFPGFDYPEDEFAAAVAHELAHNLLGHRAWLAEHGRKRTNIRLTEREADRLMPWLLANAGYDPAAATRFMGRWGPRHGGGLLRKRTHDGWDERIDFIDAEYAIIEQLWDDEGTADWATHFRREVEP